MNKLKIGILFVFCALFQTMVFAENSPVLMLSKTADEMMGALKASQGTIKKNPEKVSEVVERYLVPHVDVAGMSRSVLGRNAWNKATAEERQAFSKAFKRLVIRTYATALSEYTDEKIRFSSKEPEAGARFVRVNSLIVRSSGKNIPVSYSLINFGKEWKIYDFSVEGVSLLQSFRNQFVGALERQSMKELIARMEAPQGGAHS